LDEGEEVRDSEAAAPVQRGLAFVKRLAVRIVVHPFGLYEIDADQA